MNAVEFDRVSVVFGQRPERALAAMDAGRSRTEVQAETGQTLGVHNCTLCVEKGEILVLMGPSGSGKSTLLRTVNGLNPVARGTVRVDDGQAMITVTGARAADLRRLRLTRVAMVFQQFGLLPWRTVAQNVGLGLELAGVAAPERHARVAAQLALVGLEGWGARAVGELSGGMQQRVGLARALATEAPILLMDEPFSALDPLIRVRLQDELLDLQARLRRTIIFVTHDLDEAFRLGNRIAIMEGGRILQCGTPGEIWRRPANAHVAAFLAGLNPLTALTARDVMEPGSGDPACAAVEAGLPLREILPRLGEAALTVTASGRPIGRVTRDAALRALAPRQEKLQPENLRRANADASLHVSD